MILFTKRKLSRPFWDSCVFYFQSFLFANTLSPFPFIFPLHSSPNVTIESLKLLPSLYPVLKWFVRVEFTSLKDSSIFSVVFIYLQTPLRDLSETSIFLVWDFPLYDVAEVERWTKNDRTGRSERKGCVVFQGCGKKVWKGGGGVVRETVSTHRTGQPSLVQSIFSETFLSLTVEPVVGTLQNPSDTWKSVNKFMSSPVPV